MHQTTIHTLLLAACLLLTTQVFGQYEEPRSNNLRLGLVVQPNLSWLHYNTYPNSDPDVSLGYGLLADLGFAPNYYFSTGLIINSLNSHSALDPQTAEPAVRAIRFRYAEVPLAIKLKSDQRRFGRIYGLFGFAAGVRVSGKERRDNSNDQKNIENPDLFRLGLQIGTGLEWNLDGNLGLLTGLSYNNGFTRAIREPGSPRSSFVALHLGLLF